MQTLTPIPQKETKISPIQKKASAKILAEKGYTLEHIEKLTGMSKSAVGRLRGKTRGEITDVDSETWESVGRAINRVLEAKTNQLAAKIMGKMEHELDTKPIPFGSLAFALKVIGEIKNPKGQTQMTFNGEQTNVQVIRGNVSYNTKTEDNKGK